MSRGVTEPADIFALCRDHAVLEGELPVALCRRLRDALAPGDSGDLRFQIAFRVDQRGESVASGRVRAALRLVCQRCLEPMVWRVDRAFGLVFVRSAGEADRVRDDLEPSEAGEGRRPADLLEDELLLALPLVARHEHECVKLEPAQPDPAGSPFAVLEKLKEHKE